MADIWSWNNAVDAAGTLISSSVGSAGDLLTSNLLDPRVGRIWRAGATSASLSIQLPTTGQISLFGVFGHNYQSLGPVNLKLGTTAGAGDLWETTFDPTEAKQAVFVLRDGDGVLAPVPASFATITVAGGDPLEIGRVWLGTADWASAYGHAVDGSGWGGQDLSRKSRTSRSGAVLADRGARLRSFTANYKTLTPEEYAGSLFEMDDQGTTRQMLFVQDPDVYDPNRFAILGYLDDIPDTSWQYFMTAGRAITITEAG